MLLLAHARKHAKPLPGPPAEFNETQELLHKASLAPATEESA